jgi:hypothetical protein
MGWQKIREIKWWEKFAENGAESILSLKKLKKLSSKNAYLG